MKRKALYHVYDGVLRGYRIAAACTPRALVAILIRRDTRQALRNLSGNFELRPAAADSRFRRLGNSLAEYFDRGDLELPAPLDCWWADSFDLAVYRILRRTVPGETVSYGDIARRLGNPRWARRVGRSLARNRILLGIPCHRVIRSDRSLGGFGAGTELKRRLLGIEGNREDKRSLLALAEE